MKPWRLAGPDGGMWGTISQAPLGGAAYRFRIIEEGHYLRKKRPTIRLTSPAWHHWGWPCLGGRKVRCTTARSGGALPLRSFHRGRTGRRRRGGRAGRNGTDKVGGFNSWSRNSLRMSSATASWSSLRARKAVTGKDSAACLWDSHLTRPEFRPNNGFLLRLCGKTTYLSKESCGCSVAKGRVIAKVHLLTAPVQQTGLQAATGKNENPCHMLAGAMLGVQATNVCCRTNCPAPMLRRL